MYQHAPLQARVLRANERHVTSSFQPTVSEGRSCGLLKSFSKQHLMFNQGCLLERHQRYMGCLSQLWYIQACIYLLGKFEARLHETECTRRECPNFDYTVQILITFRHPT